jgi:LCP family protein required for cell wall assembly
MNSSRNKRVARKIIKISAVVFSFIILVVIGYGGYLYSKANASLKHISAPKSVKSENNSPLPLTTSAPENTETDELKPVTFMLAGIDNREGSGGTLNTDVMMFVALNPKTKSATIISLPRDVQLKPTNLPTHKANYYFAHFYNQEKSMALPNTKQFFSDLLHIPLDYMAVINFDGFRKLIDALNGITINVDMNMRYVDNEDGTNINLKAGIQTLNGTQTLDFVRYRKSNQGTDESSDLARNERQQQVLNELLRKLTSFNGITQWGKVLDIAGESLKTDIPEAQLRNWILNFQKIKPDSIDFIPLNGNWESPYIVPKQVDLEQALAAFRTQIGAEVYENPGYYPNVMRLDQAPPTTTQQSIE